MVRARVVAFVAGSALCALAVAALLNGLAERSDVVSPDDSAERGAALAPGVPSGPPSDESPTLDGARLSNRVAVLDPRDAEPDQTVHGEGFVVEGEIFEDRYDEAEKEWSMELRRSSGRVRYMPLGALVGRSLIEQELVGVERFTSEPLPMGDWIVETRIPGFEPVVEFAQIDEDYDCCVALRRGIEIELDVRLPDGTRPARALFALVSRDPRDPRAFGPRSDEVLQIPTCLWTPDEPRVCVSVDDPEHATELIFVAEPSGASPYDARALCRYVSSPIAVDPEADGPIRVQLRDACSLRIAVDGPEKPQLELWRWVCAVRLDGCEGFDVDALLARSRYVSDWPPELLDRAEFDWHSASSRWNEIEVSNAWYLRPGRWHVAAGWAGQPASTTRVIEVVPGITDVTLTLDQPATSDRICVRFVVDGVRVPEPTAELEFALVAAGRERARRDVGKGSVSGVGGRWFEREELLAAQREITEELAYAAPVHLVAWFTKATIQRNVFISAPLGALTGELELEKLACPDVQLHVAHTSKRIVALDLFARLVEPHPATRLVQFAVPQPIDPVHDRVLLGLRGHDQLLQGRLLPGRWRFEVHVPKAPFVAVEPIEVDLYAGQQELSVTLPELFDVTVHAPRSEVGTGIELRRLAASSTAEGEDIHVNELLDARHRAVFESLPAGQYVVSGGPTSAPLHIIVPCGEVLY